VTRRRLTDILTVFLGFLYVAAGIAETTRAVVTGDGGIPFWFGSLVGGGAMILLGSLVFRNRLRLSSTFIVLGCLAGVIATTWTLAVPILALTVMVLTVLRIRDEIGRVESVKD
jgi:hypothetical protein